MIEVPDGYVGAVMEKLEPVRRSFEHGNPGNRPPI